MFIAKLDANKKLSLTKTSINYKGENLAEEIMILLPTTYNQYSLSDCVVSLNILNQNDVGDVINLTLSASEYSGYLQYVMDIPDEWTSVSGDISLWLEILYTSTSAVIKTNEITISVEDHTVVDSDIPEASLSLLNQWQTTMNETKTIAQTAATTATTQAGIATNKASEASTSEQNASTSETNAKTSETNAKISETNAKDSEDSAKTSETNAKTSETNTKTSEDNAKISEDNAKTSEINAKTSETNAKASETTTTEQAGIATTQAGIATTKADVSTEKANAASLNKDATDINKAATDQSVIDAQGYATLALQERLAAEEAKQQAQSIASSIPVRYYRASVTDMESISSAKQGDICYVTDFTASPVRTSLYTYDTVDIDSDEINPEWVFLGILEFANMDRTTLLSILTLATVATSGSYTDLINKPNRYESFATITDGIWDYSITDKIILTTTNLVSISNVYNGAVGEIKSAFDLALPSGSVKTYDYDFMTITGSQIYKYTFEYDGVNYTWSRSVIDA